MTPEREAERKAWAAPVLEQLSVDLDAIASTRGGAGDSKGTTHQPS